MKLKKLTAIVLTAVLSAAGTVMPVSAAGSTQELFNMKLDGNLNNEIAGGAQPGAVGDITENDYKSPGHTGGGKYFSSSGKSADLGAVDYTESFSAGVWINPSSVGADAPILGNMNWSADWSKTGWQMYFQFGRPEAVFYMKAEGMADPYYIDGIALEQNKWSHLALSVDRETGKVCVYVNGLQVKSAVISDSVGKSINTGKNTLFGTSGSKPEFAASEVGFDDFRFFRGVLTNAEVYEMGKIPAAHFKFDENLNNEIQGAYTLSANNFFDAADSAPVYVPGIMTNAVKLENGRHLEINGAVWDKDRFAMAMWLKPEKIATDCPIVGNKDWGSGVNKGWILSFVGSDGKLKFSISDGSVGVIDVLGATPLPMNEWSHVAFSVDKAAGRADVYINGVHEMSISDQRLNGLDITNEATRIGQDLTGRYAQKDSLIMSYDDFKIFDTALSDTDVLQVMDIEHAGEPNLNLEWVTGAKASAQSYYTANLHVLAPNNYNKYDEIKFDVVFDPAKMSFAYADMHRYSLAIDTSDSAQGVLHCTITPEKSFMNNRLEYYSGSRIGKFTFEIAASAEGAAQLKTENVRVNKLFEDITQEVAVTAEPADIEIIKPLDFDLNKDGVVGIGDVALAADGEKSGAAAASDIYPYKRVLMVVLDGGGSAFSPNAYHMTAERDEGGVRELGKFGVNGYEDIRNNPYTIKLMNEECAAAFNMQTIHPSWSSANYNSFLHGTREYGSNATNPFYYLNEDAGEKYFYKYDAQDGSDKPSVFKILKNTVPHRALMGINQWESIMSGLVEPSLGLGSDRAGNDRDITAKVVDYINSDKMKNTAFMFIQWDDMDHYGHDSNYNFFTTKWYEKLETYDAYYKEIEEALKNNGYGEDTLVIYTADHGGYGGGHGDDYPQVRNTMFAVHGQTVNKGKRLNGEGDTSDAPAVILNALKLDWAMPECMKETNNETGSEPKRESKVFDKSMFLPQTELINKNRDVEKIGLYASGKNSVGLKVTNIKEQNKITAAEAVIDTNGQKPQITAAPGKTVLRQELTDQGRLHIVVASEEPLKEGESFAVMNFEAPCGADIKTEEAMLGLSSGDEILCDISDFNTGRFYYNGTDITASGLCPMNGGAVSFKSEAVCGEGSELLLAVYKNGRLTDIKQEKISAQGELSITSNALNIPEAELEAYSIRVYCWNSEKPMVPLAEAASLY